MNVLVKFAFLCFIALTMMPYTRQVQGCLIVELHGQGPSNANYYKRQSTQLLSRLFIKKISSENPESRIDDFSTSKSNAIKKRLN